MAKQSKNLSLDTEAVRRGERYSELHQTNISQLVSNFLSSLPLDSDTAERSLSPAVRRLLGVGAGNTAVEDYRRHLLEKIRPVKLLLDINIVLDVILARMPWAGEAAELLTAMEEGRAEGYVAGHTITTIHYIAGREQGRQAASQAVTDLLRVVHVVPLGDADFQQAIVLGLADFEDAVQASAALSVGADYLITRNAHDFRGVSVPTRTAGEALALIRD